MSDKIYDLESHIMNAWNVVDEIDMLYHYFGDDPRFTGLSPQAEDEMANLLLGVKSLYAVKFQKLWDTYEEVCREYHRRGNEIQRLVMDIPDKTESITDDDYDYVEHERQEREDKANRRSHSRMDIIGQNGNDGLHYNTHYSIDDATAKEWDEMARQYYKGDK